MSFHGETQPHFVVLPFFAPGHLIPIIDAAILLAKRGAIVTILVTPKNGNRVKGVIDRAIGSGLSIRVFHLKFPCAEAGLPEGCENFDTLPSPAYVVNLFEAIAMLRGQVEELLRELKPSPSCLIADLWYTWATNMALELHIPRIVFHVTGCFPLLCGYIVGTSKDVEAITSDTEYFVVPDIPDRIEITKAQQRGSAHEMPPYFAKLLREMYESEEEAFGLITNTFEELEREYVENYMKVRGKKVWCIGPVSLCNEEDLDKAERGNKAAIDDHQCLKWLDSQESNCVIYVCLGSSAVSLFTSQWIELCLGLEGSNCPFILVISSASDELKTWLSEEKFEERTNGRGLLIHGWAPQLLILSHPSVGGFLTHCGWNSTLEGVTAGLPMITWPLFAEQFSNEKFIVNVIKTGIRVGVQQPILFGQGENVVVQVKSDDIKKVIDKLMDGGEEGSERRERARKLGEMAKSAVEKGGSSYNNMTKLIQDVMMHQAEHVDQSANVTKLDEENSSEIIVQ